MPEAAPKWIKVRPPTDGSVQSELVLLDDVKGVRMNAGGTISVRDGSAYGEWRVAHDVTEGTAEFIALFNALGLQSQV